MIPWFVRDTIFRAWHGMNGRQVDYSANPLPWYTYNAAGTGTEDSVAHRLAVTVQDAEAWGQGNQASEFGMYADVPLNPSTMARWSFWRYDPLAAELDTAMALEPQAYALDAFSQLFTESCSFHFGYLADIDSEYHRLRPLGPLGRLDAESSQHEAWYHLYHYWRDQIEATYLSGATPLVNLPQHLRDGNWTIADVLGEIFQMMIVQGGNLDPDIIITAKGYNQGMSGITLGIQDDAAYHDADGNTRFYHPYMQVSREHSVTKSGSTINYLYTDDHGMPVDPTSPLTIGNETFSSGGLLNYVDISGAWKFYAGSPGSAPLHTASSWAYYLWDQYATNYVPLNPLDPSTGALVDNHAWPEPTNPVSALHGLVMSDFLQINDVPQSGGLTVGPFTYNYWSGHTLNLVQMIKFAKEIGRAIEPEVLDALIYPMGVVGSAEPFARRPTGASARQLDELYNLYETGYSFNENPARTYTAAHLGPTSHRLGDNDLRIAGSPISTTRGGQTLTARERYWTPSTISDSDAADIAATFFPGSRLDVTLYRGLDVEQLAAYADAGLREFISRAIGNVPSMRTKLERPIYLPAGKSGPETVYASGIGLGALQLVYEMLNAISGGRPRFGLGHHGYSDVRMSGEGFVTRGEATTDDEDMLIANIASLSADQELLGLMHDSGSWDTDLLGSTSVSSWTSLNPEYQPTWASSPGTTPSSYLSSSGNIPTSLVWAYNVAAGNGRSTNVQNGGINFLLTESNLLPRLFEGGNGCPVKTITQSLAATPQYLQWGERTFTGSEDTYNKNASNIALEDGGVSSLIGVWKIPREVTFTRNGLSRSVIVSSDPADPSDPWLEYNGAGIIPLSEFDNGECEEHTVWDEFVSQGAGLNVPGYPNPDTDPGVGASAQWRGINANGTWKTGAFNEFSNQTGSQIANVQRYAPGMSPLELTQVAFAMACLMYGHEETWRTDITEYDVSIEVEEYAGVLTHNGVANWPVLSTSGVGSQAGALAGSATIMSHYTTQYTIESASAAVLALCPEFVSVSSVIQAAGMADLELELEPLAQDGIVMRWQSVTAIAGDASRPACNAGDVMYGSTKTVFGVPFGSPHRKLGGSWSAPIVDVEAPISSWSEAGGDMRIRDHFGGALPTLTATWAGTTHPYFHTYMPEGTLAARKDHPTSQSHVDSILYQYRSIAPRYGGARGYEFDAMQGIYQGVSMPSHIVYNPVLSSVGAQLTYVFPDDPKHKMLYRPWRRIADASILKELRLIFADNGEDVTMRNGLLGIQTIGTRGQFRFAELVDAGMADTFILEQATSKTRLISPSFRSVLTFTKASLLDPAEQRHTIPDALDEVNTGVVTMGAAHKSDVGGSPVLSRGMIRELQLGRQFQHRA